MNNRVLATLLLCFSLLLLPAFSVVSAPRSEAKTEAFPVPSAPVETNLSIEELLALPGYVTAREEPTYLVVTLDKTKAPSDSTVTDPIDPMLPDPGGGGGGGGVPKTPKPAPVHTMIVIDDDARAFFGNIFDWNGMFNWANSIMEDGDDPFWDWYGIDYIIAECRIWESPQGSLEQLLGWACDAFPRSPDVEVTFVLTGQFDSSALGRGYKPGDAFIVSVWGAVFGIPLANIWQHEASHNYSYDLRDHDPGLLDFCIMSYTWYPFIRLWCSGCFNTINQNRFHFGTIYV